MPKYKTFHYFSGPAKILLDFLVLENARVRADWQPTPPKSTLPSEKCYLCLLETEQNVILVKI